MRKGKEIQELTKKTSAAVPAGLATILQGAADVLRMVADLLDGLVEELRVSPGTMSSQVHSILKSAPALLGTVQGLLYQLRQTREHSKH